MPSHYSKEDATEALLRVDEQTDGIITLADYNENRLDDDPESSIFYERFDGFNQVKRNLGLNVDNKGRSHNGPNCSEWYNYMKKLARCQICGIDDDVCLQFHHLPNRDKDINIGSAKNGSYGLNKIFSESQKCAIICANCHKRVHSDMDTPDLQPWYIASSVDKWYLEESGNSELF
jgi:hypothetical protein